MGVYGSDETRWITLINEVELTGGGRTLQIPVFSAMGRILLMYAKGSANSSQLGSNTGHSGGGMNSFSGGWVIFASLFSDSKQKYVVQGASSPHSNRAGGEILSISPCPLFPHWTQRRNYLVGGGGAREWQSVHRVHPLEKVDTLYLGYSALSRTHSMKKHLFFCCCYFFLIIFFLMSVRRVNSLAQIGVFLNSLSFGK